MADLQKNVDEFGKDDYKVGNNILKDHDMPTISNNDDHVIIA